MNLKLIDKIFTRHSRSELKSIQHYNILYKHEESKYVVKLLDRNQAKEKIPQNTQSTITLDKNTFMQSVIENIILPQPHIEANPKKVVLDFSSPNIAKPFHAGHLRSTIIGNFIANLNTHYNNNVVKINYLGDWGTQFGLLQYGLIAKNIKLNDIQNEPIKTLFEVYVYANKLASNDDTVIENARKYFADIEQGRVSLDNWQQIRAETVKELEKIYQRLGIEFDAYHWESDYNGRSIKGTIDLLENKGIIKSDKSGKKIANINDKDITILKSDQSTLYITRDIAALLDRYKKYNFDKILYIVDNSQTDHFAAVFEIVKQINRNCSEACEHIKFGRIRGMSTRTGNVVFLNDILDEAKQKMHEKQSLSKNTRDTAMNEETCDILGTSAVLINDLKQRRQKDYTFDWARALQSEGDSGIKLQYLHCRLWSLEKNCGITLPDHFEPNKLSEEVIGEVIAELAKFDNVLDRSFDEYEACILVNYLFRLARYVNKMFNVIKVKNVSQDVAAQRLLVFHCARLVVNKSLKLLGIMPLKEM